MIFRGKAQTDLRLELADGVGLEPYGFDGRFRRFLPLPQACYSASCVFADVVYRTGVMHSAIKPAFKAKAIGQAITVQLSAGDLVDPLKALEMGKAGDIIVVDAGGDTETSVCGD